MNRTAIATDRALETEAAPPSTVATNTLREPWLTVARIAWIALTLLTLALNIAMLPRFATALQTPCDPGISCFYLRPTAFDERFLSQYGLSLSFLANYQAAMNMLMVAIYCAIGALIFIRRSSDRMALLCAFVLVAFGGLAYTSILQDTLMTGSSAVYVLMGVLYILGQSSFIIFFLLFPNGRFVPRWSRWLLIAVVAYWVYDYFGNLINSQVFDWTTFIFFAFILIPVCAQIYRYRRVSTPLERQQTKWVVFGFTIAIVGFATFITAGNLLLPGEVIRSSVISTFVAQTVFAVLLSLIPISIAIAILRSRLYDIDVLINRTLVYGSLTAILAGVYILGVVGVQALVNGVARQRSSDPSPLLIVVTTLAVAALFQPLRRRLQSAIDRRFYRRKYNVARTLDRFTASLRSQTDLPELTEHLVGIVAETMQPTHVSLWLSPRLDRLNQPNEGAPA